MSPVEGLLLSLQLGDTFFPSGQSAHSYGLEGLCQSGDVCDVNGLESFLGAQLEQRWASADRVALLHAFEARGDLQQVASIDRFVDRSTSAGSLRLGGRRLGRALLRTHATLGTPFAKEYESRVQGEGAPGQASVVQGLVGFALGLDPKSSAALSAYGLAVSIVGAGLRLGIVGHVDAQRLLSRQRTRSLSAIALPLPPLEELGAWTPAAEIASMTGEVSRGRWFAT